MIFYQNNQRPIGDKVIFPAGVFSYLYEHRFIKYYFVLPEGVFYVSGSTIHYTNDPDRKKNPEGYFFAAKNITKEFSRNLEVLTNGVISLESVETKMVDEATREELAIYIPLKGWDNQNVKYLVNTKPAPLASAFIKLSSLSMALFIGIGIGILLIQFVLFGYWVTIPLRILTEGVRTEELDLISSMKKKNNEFGQLARLLEDFLNHKKKLEKESSERKHAENMLSESEEKFSKAFLFNPTPMLISSVSNGSLLSVNESFIRLSGYSSLELLGKPLDDLGLFTDSDFIPVVLNDLFVNRQDGGYETVLRNRKGETRYVLVKSDRIFLQSIECLLTVIVDITDRKQVEIALEVAREKAEESDRLKYFLMLNMSHEIRTPMTGVLGFAELIREDTKETFIRELADKILISAERLLSTLNSIMLLAEIQSGNITVHMQTVDLGSTVKTVIDKLLPLATAKSLSVISNLADGLIIEGDQEMLFQIIERIMDNAIKYTESGGISIHAGRETIETTDWAYVRITDTGIGIPSKRVNDIFLEFKQLSEGIGRNFEGIGLGLTISKRLCDILNGEISVESEMNKGSTFIIRFPFNQISS
ncbi:MAG: PAS domain-containing sensor histidine kinase [Bacteroidetes bacterium]|nr:PAS domain-containing sensor histidine kinase [Bacteroidota bacterium]